MKTNFIHFAGIDVSKKKIDVCLLINQDRSQLHSKVFEQTKSGFNALNKWLITLSAKQKDHLLICVENTGLYDDRILHYLFSQGYAVCLENAANIKRSIRDNRAKNDQLDARNIVLYALIHHAELNLWEAPRKQLIYLQQLLSERSRLIKALKILRTASEELISCTGNAIPCIKPHQHGIKGLLKDIVQVEKQTHELITADEQLCRMYQLITSIPGVGKVTAWHFILYTNEFKQSRSGKQLASYCGVVPFAKSSGSSVLKKPRLSKQANLVLKTLLHMCATTAIKMKGAFAAYYRRKVEQGKNGLVALNGLRNKLALTIAAVIRNNEPYKENYQYKFSLVKP